MILEMCRGELPADLHTVKSHIHQIQSADLLKVCQVWMFFNLLHIYLFLYIKSKSNIKKKFYCIFFIVFAMKIA